MKEDGGQAFPVNGFMNPFHQTMERWPEDGMTLRDWFAGMALIQCPENAHDHNMAALWCYKRADAMLEERKR